MTTSRCLRMPGPSTRPLGSSTIIRAATWWSSNAILELFGTFGKPIHLTELGISSSSQGVGKSEWWGGGPGGAKFVWHGEDFAETSQADWFEQVYTIAYSKPWVQAISTWDFADPAFIPNGGLISADGTPKESYRRLSALLAEWQKTA